MRDLDYMLPQCTPSYPGDRSLRDAETGCERAQCVSLSEQATDLSNVGLREFRGRAPFPSYLRYASAGVMISPLRPHVVHVVLMRALEKMALLVIPDAQRHIAGMERGQAWGNRSTKLHAQGEAMGANVPAIDHDESIASGLTSRSEPKPAIAGSTGLRHLEPETLLRTQMTQMRSGHQASPTLDWSVTAADTQRAAIIGSHRGTSIPHAMPPDVCSIAGASSRQLYQIPSRRGV